MTLTQPEVLEVVAREDSVTVELRVPAALEYFRGHFQQQPILPGVVQLAWANALGRLHLNADGEMLRLEAIKFSRIVRPESQLSLALRWSAPRGTLSFRYREKGLDCSSGQFVFAK